jgi:Ca2+-binding RTX toxin-like protein
MAATTSQSTIQLTAQAILANGIGAEVYLLINGNRVGLSQFVTSQAWSGQPSQVLTFTFDTPSQVNSIGIEFANDEPGNDRALLIQGLKVNGTALTESGSEQLAFGNKYPGSWNMWFNSTLNYNTTERQDLFASTGGSNTVGTDAAETLIGTNYNDTLNGGGGNDTLIGGLGNDQMTGGIGADMFRFSKGGGQDTILDFNAAQGDIIDLTGTGITGLDKLQVSSSGNNRVINLGDGTTISLANATAPQASWFKFDPLPGGTNPAPAPTQSTVELSAWADLANSIGAEVRLVINGVPVGPSQFVTANRWGGQGAQNLIFTFDTPAEVHSLAIEFVNDMVDGGNRSLYINALKVNGVALTAAEGRLITSWGNTATDWNIWYNGKVSYDMTNRQDIFKPVPGVLKNGTDAADSLAGAGGADTLNGAGGNDTLVGGDSTDILNGGAGDDLLNGGAGIDTMAGGIGNDRYVVDHASDVVNDAANEGNDTVEASVSWSLGANTEHLTLTGNADLNGNGNALANSLIGNAGSNLLSGGAGNDTLDGGVNGSGKVDTLAGGAGDDIYIVRSASDVVRENAGEGSDTVRAAVTHSLAANVENLTLTGTSSFNGVGNELANLITGNAGANALDGLGGNDTIIGGDGNDIIIGGTGNDQLTGGAGADTFRFTRAAGQDVITDFNSAQGDLIDLTGTGIKGLEGLQISSNGSNHVIGLGDGTTINLNGATAPQASWFKFDSSNGGGGNSSAAGPVFDLQSVTLTSYWGGNFATSGGLSAMDQIAATGANSITLVPHFFQENQYSNTMGLRLGDPNNPWDNESDTFAQVKQAILDAKARGLEHVVLKPHLESVNRVWRAEFSPTDAKEWFANYKGMMLEYAKVAQEAGADMICVGTEMVSMTDPTKVCSDGVSYTDKWKDIISSVKSVFSGETTYAATYSEAPKVRFWSIVDKIGVNPYVPLAQTNTATVDEMKKALNETHFNSWVANLYQGKSVVDYYKSLSEQYGKQVFFTEIGYRSLDGGTKDPGVFGSGGTVDYQEQADAYRALFEVMEESGGQWFAGLSSFAFYPYANKQDMTAAGVGETDYTVQFKQAAGVLQEHYSGPSHRAGRTLTGTNGNDKLDGGYHNDVLQGGAGNDVLWGGKGHDTLSGGLGADRFEFGTRSGNDTITDFDRTTAGEVIAIAKNANDLDLSTFQKLMARTTTVGSDSVIDLGNGNSLKIAGVEKALLNASHFVFI